MNRKFNLILICILIIGIFNAGILSAYAQTESATAETAEQSSEQETGENETTPAADENSTEAVPAAENETVTEAPAAPVPEAPKGNINSKEIGFYWAPSANAEHYEIVWGNDRGIEEVRLELPADDWTCQSGRCILFEELPSDGNYSWTVSAVNEAGETISEAAAFSVKAPLPSSEGYLPGAVLSNQKPLSFQWGDIGSSASTYRIQILNRDSDQICLDKWYGLDRISFVNGVHSLDTDEYLPSGFYAWRVQGRNEESVSGWSAWKDFAVNCTECDLGTYLNTETCIIAPNGSVTDPEMSFTWKTVMGASKYQMEIKHSDGTELLLTDITPEVCGVEVCSWKPDIALDAGESYEWSLLTYGWNDIFWGSDNRTFSVAALPEAEKYAIEFIGAEENLSLDPDNQQIVWTDPGTGPVAFRVGVSDSEGNWLLVSDLTREEAWCDGLTCSVQFFTIPEGENYLFTLVPYNEFNIPGEPFTLTFSNKG